MMPENMMFSNVKKVLGVVSELKSMSVEDLKDICLQYGTESSSSDKEELIQLILQEELTKSEYDDYQKYLKYYYFTLFREHTKGLNLIDETNNQLQGLYDIKSEAASEKRIADDKRKRAELATSDALPLIRLNIEYGHADRSFKDYIKVMTRTGMKRAKLSDEIEDLKKKNVLYKLLKKKSILEKEQAKEEFEVEASSEMGTAYDSYLKAMKAYADILRELFYKMLDNRDVAEAVLLYKTVSMDFSSKEAYKVGFLYDTKIALDEKEQIFEDFLNVTNFDPEVDVTGEIFFEAAKKYVCRYYDLMSSRNALKISKCINAMEEIVKKQREILDTLNYNQEQFDLFIPEEDKTLSLLYEETGRLKK